MADKITSVTVWPRGIRILLGHTYFSKINGEKIIVKSINMTAKTVDAKQIDTDGTSRFIVVIPFGQFGKTWQKRRPRLHQNDNAQELTAYERRRNGLVKTMTQAEVDILWERKEPKFPMWTPNGYINADGQTCNPPPKQKRKRRRRREKTRIKANG